MNPDIYGNTLSLNVDANDNSINFELAIETAKYYEVKMMDAKTIVADIKTTVSKNWSTLAADCGLTKKAIDGMEPAFLYTLQNH